MTAPREEVLLRHGNVTRVAHWAVAIAFVALFLSGLALFHPFFFWISALFGGGPFLRILHPFAGVALVLVFYPYAAAHLRDNRWLPVDGRWVRNMGAYMRNEHPDVGETHKYNAGQKLMYWSMIPILALLLLTGLLVWQPWIAPHVPAGVRRAAGLLHAVGAFVMFVGIGIHVYAAIWTKGSIDAMIRGTVSGAWARFHHPAWYREMTGREPR